MLSKYSLFIFFKKHTVTKQILITEWNDWTLIFLASLVPSSFISWGKSRPSSMILSCCAGRARWAFIAIWRPKREHWHTNTSGNLETDKRCFSLTLNFVVPCYASLTDLGPQVCRGVGTAAIFIQSRRSANEPALYPPTGTRQFRQRPLTKPKSFGLSPGHRPSLGAGSPRWTAHPAPEWRGVASDGNSHLLALGEIQRQIAYGCFEDPSEMYFVLEVLLVLRQTPGSWYTCTLGTRACRGAAECSRP